MSNCVECQYTHLVWYHDADLPTPVAALVEAHIDDCLACRTEAAGEAAVAKVVQRVAPEPAPATLRMRIQAQFVALSYESGQSMAE